MKKIFKYTFVALLGAMTFSACTDKYEYDGVGSAENANASGVYFSEKNYSKNLEVEPDAKYFDISLSRNNTDAAQTVGISVISDEAGVFEVPTTVTFAEGESTTNLHITASKAEEGGDYKLILGITESGIYTAGLQEFTINLSVQKWEKLGTGYWLDGALSGLFGLDASIPYAVQVEKLITEKGCRFRFYGPYSHVATGKDEIGYIGYPYNQEGDCDEEDHLFVINVTEKGASLTPVAIGADWGYGPMTIGTVVGNLTSSDGAVITDTNSYPLGVYNEKAGVITFPKNSFFINLPQQGIYLNSIPSYLYLSAEAYINAVSGEE